jgi:hypothetical protein
MMLSLVRVIAVFTLLTLFASAQDVRTADLILRHGAIYTMDAARSWAEAVAIADRYDMLLIRQEAERLCG